MVAVREVEYEDLEAIARLQQAAGWRPPTEEDLRHFWAENPARAGSVTAARGWVLVDGQDVVGCLSNLAHIYQLGEQKLLAAIAVGMVVAPAFRGSSMQLIVAFARQRNVDLLLNTTAAPHVSKISEFLKFTRIPQPGYDRSLYWVLRSRPFARAALRKKGWPAYISRPTSALLGPLLWAEGRLRGRGPQAAASGAELRTIAPEAIGPEFDDLWRLKVAEGPRLLAVRDAQTLRWHFAARGRRNPPRLICAYKGPRLVGYAALVRQDAPHLTLERARLADLFVERDDPHVIRHLLHGAAAEARRGGAAMLEVVGFPAHVRAICQASRPFELLADGWPFLYKTTDPALQRALAGESSWSACLYDGDGSL